MRRWDWGKLWNVASVAVSAGMLTALALSLINVVEHFITMSDEKSLQARITELTGSLRESADIIAAIEEEFDRRRELVTELEQKAEVAEHLLGTRREEVEAISTLLRSELERDQWWDYSLDLAKDVVLVVAGAFIGFYVNRWMSRRRAARQEDMN